jgi:aquaporin NIP
MALRTHSPHTPALVSEAVGTFTLIFAGCGAIVIDSLTAQIGHVAIAVVFGLVILVMIDALGHISGAHLNPAVTIAFAVTRRQPWWLVPRYVAAQAVGATLAALALRALFGPVASLGATFPAGSATQSLVLEVVITFLLMFVISAMATDPRAHNHAAIAIASTVTFVALFAGPISGASMNPIRSLAPALVAGTWTSQWIYLVGPVVGAIIGAVAYQTMAHASHLADVPPATDPGGDSRVE